MTWAKNLSVDDFLALKPRGFFRIAPAAGGFVVSVFLPGEPVQRIVCATPGIANRVKSQLSDAGLAGYVEGAR